MGTSELLGQSDRMQGGGGQPCEGLASQRGGSISNNFSRFMSHKPLFAITKSIATLLPLVGMLVHRKLSLSMISHVRWPSG